MRGHRDRRPDRGISAWTTRPTLSLHSEQILDLDLWNLGHAECLCGSDSTIPSEIGTGVRVHLAGINFREEVTTIDILGGNPPNTTSSKR
jgi:hypothetical protein